MKLTNTFKHFTYGCGIALVAGIVIGALKLFDLAIFVALAFMMVTLAWEKNQSSDNWIDTVFDILAGNAGFNIVFWIIMYMMGYWT